MIVVDMEKKTKIEMCGGLLALMTKMPSLMGPSGGFDEYPAASIATSHGMQQHLPPPSRIFWHGKHREISGNHIRNQFEFFECQFTINRMICSH